MATRVRRVVTGKDASGKAVAIVDEVVEKIHVRAETGVANTVLWATAGAPARLADASDATKQKVGVVPPANGTIFKIIEFAPEKHLTSDYETRLGIFRGLNLAPEGPDQSHPRNPGMHRTATIDYVVVLSGEIYMLLDDTDILLKAGDVVVQRGTNHAWMNRSDEPCRMAFILVDATD